MSKVTLGAKPLLTPMPAVLVGALVQGKPNYCTVAYCGIVNHQPPMLSISVSAGHHTTAGIRATGTFSVNIPSRTMVEVTDYCGIVSGKAVDKSSLFTVFTGTLGTAPLISECPLNLECRVTQTLDFPGDVLFIAEIVEVYLDEACLTDGRFDTRKVDPLTFTWDHKYWALGECLGNGWEVGRYLRKVP